DAPGEHIEAAEVVEQPALHAEPLDGLLDTSDVEHGVILPSCLPCGDGGGLRCPFCEVPAAVTRAASPRRRREAFHEKIAQRNDPALHYTVPYLCRPLRGRLASARRP